jgi:DivIVA domain-containing protein
MYADRAEPIGRHRLTRRISADQIRSASFTRTALGRRGFTEDEVIGFLHRIAEEIGGLETELANAHAENARIKTALRDWQTQAGGGASVGTGLVLPAEAVNLLSRAQRQIEAQVAETERYCRLREVEAHERYNEVVNRARQHAKEDAERVALAYRASVGNRYSPEGERAERTGVWLDALLRSLDALAAHVDATRRSFAVEVEKLVESSPTAWTSAQGPMYGRPVVTYGHRDPSHP